jgi:hypothetical protein
MAASKPPWRSPSSGFESATAALGTPIEGIGAIVEGGAVGVDDEFEAEPGGVAIAELDHFFELIAGIDVQQRERDGAGEEGLLGEAEEHRRVFADGIEQYRTLTFGDHFAHDVDAFRLELLEMSAGRHYGQDSTMPSNQMWNG